MRSILVVCTEPNEHDAAFYTASRLAAAIGASMSVAVWDETTPYVIGEQAREIGAELVVMQPQVPVGVTAIDFDRAATRVVLGSEAAVLVVPSPIEGTIRRILIPVRRIDLERCTLPTALEWAGRLCGSTAGGNGEARRTEIHVLHISRDPDEMYADSPVLLDQLETIEGSLPLPLAIQIHHCGRWGAPLRRRISRQITRLRSDLVIQSRGSLDDSSEEPDTTWLQILLGAAHCPVLLLPLERGVDECRPTTGQRGRPQTESPIAHALQTALHGFRRIMGTGRIATSR